MATKLADELLQMILAPSLTISDEHFIDSSSTAFGENDSVSSASALLVCKRWLRVATPLLYDTVIIRSTGQSHALADAFRQNPIFALHVRKIRLEGAYSSIGDVLQPCKNLNTLVILLRVYCDANVKGLCRALPLIDPKVVILRDEWQIDNAKIRKTFIALCDAIATWKNLTTFGFPYHNPGCGSTRIEPNVSRREKLIDSLIKSPSLRKVFCEIPRAYNFPETYIPVWRHLATIPSVTIHVRYQSKVPWEVTAQQKIAEAIKNDARLTKCSFEFIDVSEPPLQQAPEQTKPVPNLPLKSVTSIPEDIWTTIFLFATIPELPDIPLLAFETIKQLNATRKHLCLVCKSFERLIRPLLFIFPLFSNNTSFIRFVDKVLKTPALGPKIRILSLSSLHHLDHDANTNLCALLPHLTSLRHFIGYPGWLSSISPKAFELLAAVAGSTLLTITGVELRGQHPFPASVLASFKRLVKLDISSTPVFATKGALDPETLSTLRELRLEGPSDLLDSLSALRLPRLRSLKFTDAATPTLEKFLEACGSRLEELDFAGSAQFEVLLRHTPQLRTLRWEPEDQLLKSAHVISGSLSRHAAHETLEKFVMRGILELRSGEREHNMTVGSFFVSLDLAKFPALKEIQFLYYSWPVEERAISKDTLPMLAVDVKAKHGINVTDRSGKPWRPRAQSRKRR